jgi:hypothetical protein
VGEIQLRPQNFCVGKCRQRTYAMVLLLFPVIVAVFLCFVIDAAKISSPRIIFLQDFSSKTDFTSFSLEEQLSFLNVYSYCQRHSYAYQIITINTTYFAETIKLHDSWIKVFAINEFIRTVDEERTTDSSSSQSPLESETSQSTFDIYDWVVYVDSSYFITNPSIPLTRQLKIWNRFSDIFFMFEEEENSFVLSSNSSSSSASSSSSSSSITHIPNDPIIPMINSGFMVWRNTAIIKKCLQLWIMSTKDSRYGTRYSFSFPYEVGTLFLLRVYIRGKQRMSFHSPSIVSSWNDLADRLLIDHSNNISDDSKTFMNRQISVKEIPFLTRVKINDEEKDVAFHLDSHQSIFSSVFPSLLNRYLSSSTSVSKSFLSLLLLTHSSLSAFLSSRLFLPPSLHSLPSCASSCLTSSLTYFLSNYEEYEIFPVSWIPITFYAYYAENISRSAKIRMDIYYNNDDLNFLDSQIHQECPDLDDSTIEQMKRHVRDKQREHRRIIMENRQKKLLFEITAKEEKKNKQEQERKKKSKDDEINRKKKAERIRELTTTDSGPSDCNDNKVCYRENSRASASADSTSSFVGSSSTLSLPTMAPSVSSKTIVTIFAGRENRLSLVMQYLITALDYQIIQEIHLWDFCRNSNDSLFLLSYRQGKYYEKAIFIKNRFTSRNTWNDYYDYYNDYGMKYPEDIILKLDDDIVFIDLLQLGYFIQLVKETTLAVVGGRETEKKKENDNHDEDASIRNGVLFANIINNGVCAYYQQSKWGMLPLPNGSFASASSASFTPAANATITVPLETLDYYEYPTDGLCGTLWEDGSRANSLHNYFLKHWKQIIRPFGMTSSDSPDYQPEYIEIKTRFSINFFGIKAGNWKTISKGGEDDEVYITLVAPKVAKIQNYLVSNFIVSHLSFGSQTHGLNITEKLQEYQALYEEYMKEYSLELSLRSFP